MEARQIFSVPATRRTLLLAALVLLFLVWATYHSLSPRTAPTPSYSDPASDCLEVRVRPSLCALAPCFTIYCLTIFTLTFALSSYPFLPFPVCSFLYTFTQGPFFPKVRDALLSAAAAVFSGIIVSIHTLSCIRSFARRLCLHSSV